MVNKVASRLTDPLVIGAVCRDFSLADVFYGLTPEQLGTNLRYFNLTAGLSTRARSRYADRNDILAAVKDNLPPWKIRSWWRFKHGIYTHLPFRRCDFTLSCTLFQQHFPHIDPADSTKIRYFQSVEHAIADRHTTTSLGKYLTKYYEDFYSEEQIRDIASCFTSNSRRDGFAILETAEDIVAAYRNGIHSCMAYRSGEYGLPEHQHPVEVYGNSDLQLAVLRRPGSSRITARGLIWPARKLYCRLYGDHVALQDTLESLGYSHGSFEGARICRIDADGHEKTILMPYIDAYNPSSVHQTAGSMNVHVTETDVMLTTGRVDDRTTFSAGSTGGKLYVPELQTCDNCDCATEEVYETVSGDRVCFDCRQEYVQVGAGGYAQFAHRSDPRLIYNIDNHDFGWYEELPERLHEVEVRRRAQSLVGIRCVSTTVVTAFDLAGVEHTYAREHCTYLNTLPEFGIDCEFLHVDDRHNALNVFLNESISPLSIHPRHRQRLLDNGALTSVLSPNTLTISTTVRATA